MLHDDVSRLAFRYQAHATLRPPFSGEPLPSTLTASGSKEPRLAATVASERPIVIPTDR